MGIEILVRKNEAYQKLEEDEKLNIELELGDEK